eukprot:TRINITY_DN24608_c0_g1_i1.p2 TRINITY_DN24608_c0_g1~~TRINITY_DN24608_c0_g1_i1.p2  ORF type:complete len:129 (-),score=17.26 TRINITY_DN24608_c0_g1_i1:238-576(-)
MTGSAEAYAPLVSIASQDDTVKMEVMAKTEDLTKPGFSDIAIDAVTNKVVATAGWDHRIRVFKFSRKLKPLAILKGHTDTINDLAFSAKDTYTIASASNDGRIGIWSLDFSK